MLKSAKRPIKSTKRAGFYLLENALSSPIREIAPLCQSLEGVIPAAAEGVCDAPH